MNDAATAQERSDSPFRGLYATDGVNTSRDEYAIRLHWTATEFRIAYGPYLNDPETQANHGEDAAWITVSCRGNGKPDGFDGPQPLTATLRIPRHHQEKDTYSVMNPMYWILRLTDNEWNAYQARVHIEAGELAHTSPSRLLTTNIAYNTRRPEGQMDIPPRPILNALTSGQEAQLTARGPAFSVEASFAHEPRLQEAAALMLQHCQ